VRYCTKAYKDINSKNKKALATSTIINKNNTEVDQSNLVGIFSTVKDMFISNKKI